MQALDQNEIPQTPLFGKRVKDYRPVTAAVRKAEPREYEEERCNKESDETENSSNSDLSEKDTHEI